MDPVRRVLLVTDVVDSTRLVESLGDRGAAELWAAHDTRARELLAAHGGREIDKTDGFLLLFESVPDALAYAAAYHAAIAGLTPPLEARAGIHAADVVLRQTPADQVALGAKPLEVEGIGKPTAARVMSVARPGQTLLSAQAADGIAGLRSLGFWRMKGVTEPEELFAVSGEPPADGAKVVRVVRLGELWVPAAELPHTLPRERDPFVGRVRDLTTLADQLESGRLVSVLGIGGTGKTRLAVHYGWSWLWSWPGGVWFCDLSEARGADDILARVARVLGLSGGANTAEELAAAIDGRGRCLVILDNFEQITRFAHETLGVWLDRTRQAAFVVTTREVLGLPGESMIALRPLELDEAVRLFETRAQAARPDRTTEAPAVLRELVTVLDRLPLAIELAAARVRMMRPSAILERLSQRFKLLAVPGRRDRQATLRGAIDWSWDLLAPWEKRALAQLSVFEGGFTLEAAEAILDLDDAAWPMDAVQSLVDKSLVIAGQDRFDLLVTVQEYAAEKLDASGEREATEQRHGSFYARFGAPEERRKVDQRGNEAFVAALDAEESNTLFGARRAIARRDARLAVPLAAAFWEILQRRGPHGQADALFRQIQALDLDASARLDVLAAHAHVLDKLGRYAESLALLEEIERSASDDLGRLASALGGKAVVLRTLGRSEEAAEVTDRVIPMWRDLGDDERMAHALSSRATSLYDVGRYDDARTALLEALGLVGNNRFVQIAILGQLSSVECTLGDHGRGLDHALRIIELCRESGDVEGLARAHERAALACNGLGRTDERDAHRKAALDGVRRAGDRDREALILSNLAGTFRNRGQITEAIEHGEQAVAVAVGIRFQALACAGLAELYRMVGRRDDGRAAAERALELHRRTGDQAGVAGALGELAEHVDPEEAMALREQSLEIRERLGVPMAIAVAAANLGIAHFDAGRPDTARVWLERALERLGGSGDPAFKAWVHANIGRVDVGAGDLAAARARIERAEREIRPTGHVKGLTEVLLRKAELILADDGDPTLILDEVEALADQLMVWEDHEYRRDLRALRERAGRTPTG